MCDCYVAKCTMCSCSIAIHIADYCTSRDEVHPYCNRCTRKIKKKGKKYLKQIKYITFDKIERNNQVEGGKIGEEVLIVYDDPNAYGISLN